MVQLDEALLGRRGFALPQRLFWRGAWGQALPIAVGVWFAKSSSVACVDL